MKEVITPIYNHILVLPDKEETEVNGYIMPDGAREKPQRGTVIAAGPGVYGYNDTRIPLDVTPGDIVLFGKYAGSEIKINDTTHLLMDEKEIFGISTMKEE